MSTQTLLWERCAWCFQSIAADTPIIGLYAALSAASDSLDDSTGSISIVLAGRLVPAFCAEGGSPAALAGYDLGFKVCGAGCAVALRMAIASEGAIEVRAVDGSALEPGQPAGKGR